MRDNTPLSPADIRLDTSTGELVRVITGSTYRFHYPNAMVLSGTDLFVANDTGNSVTELNALMGAGEGGLRLGLQVRVRSGCRRHGAERGRPIRGELLRRLGYSVPGIEEWDKPPISS
jgi:hypothetical protein